MFCKSLWIASTLATLSILQSGVAHSQTCITVGATRAQAADKTVEQCEAAARDCDPYQGKWYCSNDNLNKNTLLSWLQQSNDTGVTESPITPTAACVDTDGDGWGWNGHTSCQMLTHQNQVVLSVTADQALNSDPQCVDTDGDGWGWDGIKSCKISTASLLQVLQDAVPAAPAASISTESQDSFESDPSCSGQYGPSDITDMILVTGQSNVTGAQTAVAGDYDRWGNATNFHAPDQPHERVFAWTIDPHDNNSGTGWKVAALNQSWHDSSPGVGGLARNNFGFHFAKKLADSGRCRVVGIVMVSEGGRGISHWDNGATGWIEINRHVGEAMSAIGRSTIDGVLWHQGESDWIADGTCFTGSTCRNNQPDYYAQKLYSKIADPNIANPVGSQALIDRIRRTSWFGENRPFIAGETIKAPVNIHLNKLNSDNDTWTATVRGDALSGLGIRADDPHKNHYNAEGLREIGARYAQSYLDMTGK